MKQHGITSFQLLIPLFLCLVGGALFYGFYHSWIIFQFPWQKCSYATLPIAPAQKKTITLTYWKDARFIQEKKEIVWSDAVAYNTTYLIKNWLQVAYEENSIPQQTMLQSVIINDANQEAFVSFDHSLVSTKNPAHDQLMVIEGLLKTIRDNNLAIRSVRFLVHHKPMYAYHLDFSMSWPIEGFTHTVPPKITVPQTKQPLHTIILDPAGDAQYTGRTIEDTFERSLTLQYAQELKRRIEEALPHVTVILTRFPGDIIEPLQNATFANRLAANLYINIHFYHTTTHPHAQMFYVLQHPETDFWKKKDKELTFTPYYRAHTHCLPATITIAQIAAQSLKIAPPIGLPFKPLIGITIPAFALEIGIAHKDEWKHYIEPLIQALSHLNKVYYT